MWDPEHLQHTIESVTHTRGPQSQGSQPPFWVSTEQKAYVTASGLLLTHMIPLPWGWRGHSEGLDSAHGPHVSYFSHDYL